MYIQKSEEQIAEELLKAGINSLREENYLEALASVEKSFQMRETSRSRSYFGLLIARERGKIREGMAMCNAALEEEPENPEFYLNLARVLYMADRKEEGILTARKGLICRPHSDTVAWLRRVGIRRKPVFPFLPRRHFLNKYIGLFLARIGLK